MGCYLYTTGRVEMAIFQGNVAPLAARAFVYKPDDLNLGTQSGARIDLEGAENDQNRPVLPPDPLRRP
jgi:hypothetical protein